MLLEYYLEMQQLWSGTEENFLSKTPQNKFSTLLSGKNCYYNF